MTQVQSQCTSKIKPPYGSDGVQSGVANGAAYEAELVSIQLDSVI